MDAAVQDPDESTPARQVPRFVYLVAGLVVIALLVAGVALVRGSGSPARKAALTAEFGGSEGIPCCTYDASTKSVDAEFIVDGTTASGDKVTVSVTLTAYADENKEFLVGTSRVSVQVSGRVHLPMHIIIPVSRAPMLDDDGIVIVGRSVTYRHSKRAGR